MNKQTKSFIIIAVLILQSIFVNANFYYNGYTSTEQKTDEGGNQGLSERRAQAVVDKLIENGISEGRIRSSGAGETNQQGSNPSDNKVTIITFTYLNSNILKVERMISKPIQLIPTDNIDYGGISGSILNQIITPNPGGPSF